MKRTVAYFLALILLFSSVGAIAADDDIYVYNAKITNSGAERLRFSLTASGKQTPVSVNFKLGTVNLSNYYESRKVFAQGQTAYISFPDGEEFSFSCAFKPSTGEISVSINGENYITAAYSYLRGKTPSPAWFLNSISSTAISDDTAVKISDTESFYLSEREQGAEVQSMTLADVSLSFTLPVKYAELSKLSIFDESGENIKVCDILKDNENVTLKFSQKLAYGKKYIVSGEKIADIYGGSFSFQKEFTPSEDKSLAEGKDIAISEDTAKILNFEEEKVWRTEADFLGDNPEMTQEDLAIYLGFEEQSFAAPLTSDKKSSGSYSVKWENHPYYPTLSAKVDNLDFTGANAVKLWIYSEKATFETVVMMIYSDNSKTLWKDGYVYPIEIDFEGAKEITVPLEDFYKFNEPEGFANVSRIYFSTKIFNLTPNPETVLYIDNLRILYDDAYPITPNAQIYVKNADNHRGDVYDWSLLNHDFPEVQNQAVINTEENTFIKYSPYYKTERALYGYYPKYAPAVPSFDSEGNAYFYKNGCIEWLDDEGKWQLVDLEQEFLKHYGDRKFNFTIYDQMAGDETVIRFDSSGGVYAAMTVYEVPYLFYSPDKMITWQCYDLTRQEGAGISAKEAGSTFIRFERIEAHNRDASKNTPAIIYGNYLIVPEKTDDGGLTFKTVKYGENMVGHNNHSGDGNSLITIGGNIYVVYSKIDVNLTDAERAALPDENSAANTLSWQEKGITYYSKDGTRAFIKRINRSTLEVSEPVFAGYGGHGADDHNWPNITVDSEKRLHVFVNGHHDPIYYSHTLKGDDLSEWSEPILFGKAKNDSYASILTDKDDTIYVITRDSGSVNTYRFDLSLYIKKKGETAFTHDYLVQRRFSYYKVWRNRLVLDPVSGKIYVYYYSQSGSDELFKENFDAYTYIWPDKERLFIKQNGIPVVGEGKLWYNTTVDDSGFEGTVLVTDDGAKTFRLAQTGDFKGQNALISQIYEINLIDNQAEVKVKAIKDASANVFLGLYNDEGKLFKVLKKPIDLVQGTNNSVTFEDAKGAANVEAFLWSDALKPYSAPKKSE